MRVNRRPTDFRVVFQHVLDHIKVGKEQDKNKLKQDKDYFSVDFTFLKSLANVLP